MIRSYLKKVFWSPASGGIGASFKNLDILEYACCRSDCYAVGLKLGPAAKLNQNLFFEMASTEISFLSRTLKDRDPLDLSGKLA